MGTQEGLSDQADIKKLKQSLARIGYENWPNKLEMVIGELNATPSIEFRGFSPAELMFNKTVDMRKLLNVNVNGNSEPGFSLSIDYKGYREWKNNRKYEKSTRRQVREGDTCRIRTGKYAWSDDYYKVKYVKDTGEIGVVKKKGKKKEILTRSYNSIVLVNEIKSRPAISSSM